MAEQNKQDSRIEEVKKILDQHYGESPDGMGNLCIAKLICKLFPPLTDDKDLREKIDKFLHQVEYDWRFTDVGEVEHYKYLDFALALLQPKIEEAILQARKEQMVIDWAEAGKDVEEAKKEERERLVGEIEDGFPGIKTWIKWEALKEAQNDK